MNLIKHLFTALLIVASLSHNDCFSQLKSISGSTIGEAQLDSFLHSKMDELQMAGLSIAVLNEGKVVYSRSLGLANEQTKERVMEQTIFETASITKPVFAYFTMKMVQQNLIDLDTPLYHYLPNYELDHDPRYKKITARQVLSHQSGLPNWRYMTNKMMYLELLSDPGSEFAYSGEGYEYLANVIAHLKGGSLASLDSILNAEVLVPLNMDNSHFVWNDRMNKYKACGHMLPNIANDRWEPLLARAAGGLHSNAQDFAKFLIAIMKDEGLNSELFSEMLKSHARLPEDNEIRSSFSVEEWSLGFAIENTSYGSKYSHGGNNGDFQSYFELYKDAGIGYVFMTNTNKGIKLNEELNDFLTNGMMQDEISKFEIINRKAEIRGGEKSDGVSLNRGQGSGFAWLRNETFNTGTIELEVKGEDLREKSFVGIAFNAVDESNYESVYFRPYLFESAQEDEKNFMVQYISMPKHDWFNLRSAHPGRFEDLAADNLKAEDWIKVKIEVEIDKLSVYVNDNLEPSLVCDRLGQSNGGKIGFWVGNGSGGEFANLQISSD